MGLVSKLMFLRNYRRYRDEKNRIKYREERFNKWTSSFKNKNPHYFKLFTHFYGQNIRVDTMMELFNDLKQYKKSLYLLPRNVIQYKNFFDLSSDLEVYVSEYDDLCDIPYVRKYFRKLYTSDQHKMVNKSLTHNGEPFARILYKTKKLKGFIKFLKEHDLPPLGDGYMADRKKYIENYILLLKQNGCKILYNYNNIVISKVPNYKSMRMVGISSWCIKKKGEWENHIEKKDTQLIIKDFNRVIDATFGITLTKRFEVKHIYDEDNCSRYESSTKKYMKLVISKRKLKKIKKKNIIDEITNY
tara:strand:+ start:13816 stop:14721 length:906 start_codon:yes stop_codon:yes gene_type:complete